MERISHRFVSGVDDESIGYAAESLRLLRAEVMRRTERLKALDRALCPDKRVTRQIAGKRSLKLWPIVAVFDEAQNLFAHPEHGKAAGLDAEFIIKIGPAFGVFLVIATQRPDKASLPTGVSGNVSTRFCLKVTGQVENDMILGTSAYKNGLRSTTFRPGIDAGIGYLVGAGPSPQVVRTFYLNMADTERVAARARALREAAGTVTGHAAEGAGEGPRDVLTDVLAVFGSDAGLQWATSPRGWRPGSRPGGTAPPLMRSRPSAAPPASPQSTSAAAAGRARAAAARQSRPRQAPGEPPHKGRRRLIR
jgi:S-DNA-T family DNA segregation ATPase FtsK/SpoIIIE